MSFAEAHARWATGEPSFVDSADSVPEQDAPTRVPIEAETSNVAGTVPQWIYDSLLRSYEAERAMRKDSSALFSIASLLEEILATQRRMLAALGSSSDSRSSVEVKTSTRGVDIASKCYASSSMDDLSERAVAEYFATLEDVQRRLTGGQT